MTRVYKLFDEKGKLIKQFECNFVEEYIRFEYRDRYDFTLNSATNEIHLTKKK